MISYRVTAKVGCRFSQKPKAAIVWGVWLRCGSLGSVLVAMPRQRLARIHQKPFDKSRDLLKSNVEAWLQVVAIAIFAFTAYCFYCDMRSKAEANVSQLLLLFTGQPLQVQMTCWREMSPDSIRFYFGLQSNSYDTSQLFRWSSLTIRHVVSYNLGPEVYLWSARSPVLLSAFGDSVQVAPTSHYFFAFYVDSWKNDWLHLPSITLGNGSNLSDTPIDEDYFLADNTFSSETSCSHLLSRVSPVMSLRMNLTADAETRILSPHCQTRQAVPLERYHMPSLDPLFLTYTMAIPNGNERNAINAYIGCLAVALLDAYDDARNTSNDGAILDQVLSCPTGIYNIMADVMCRIDRRTHQKSMFVDIIFVPTQSGNVHCASDMSHFLDSLSLAWASSEQVHPYLESCLRASPSPWLASQPNLVSSSLIRM